MAWRSTKTASAARRSKCCPIRISRWLIWPSSGRSLGELAPKIAEQIETDAKYRRLSGAPGVRYRVVSPRRELHAAGRLRLCLAAGPVERGQAEAHRQQAAHHRPGRQDRRRDAGGADLAGGACEARPQSARQAACKVRVKTPDLSADKARALKLTPVSRETLQRLESYVELLLQWQAEDESDRAIDDSDTSGPVTSPTRCSSSISPPTPAPGSTSARAADFRRSRLPARSPDNPAPWSIWLRAMAKRPRFLREAIRVTGAPAQVHPDGSKNILQTPVNSVDVVSARALAPLKVLCDQAFPLIERGAIGLFPKGLDVAAELTEAAKYWNIDATTVASKTSPEGCIVIVKDLKPL